VTRQEKPRAHSNKPFRSFSELFFTFCKISFLTIGGGAAMIPMVVDVAVERKKWLTEEEMVDCIAVAQSLPGAVIINTATYIGKKRAGIAGSLFAVLGTILPSLIVMLALITALSAFGDNRYLAGFFRGALSAAAAMVAVAAFRLGKPVLKKPADWILAGAAFVALIVFGVSIVYIILASIAVGFGLYFARRRLSIRKAARNSGKEDSE
jgi:chromate transporter